MSYTAIHSDKSDSDLTGIATKPKRRRNRRPKACQACRARKVRCDYDEPCSTCRKRQHPHLCIYVDVPSPRRGTTTAQLDFPPNTPCIGTNRTPRHVAKPLLSSQGHTGLPYPPSVSDDDDDDDGCSHSHKTQRQDPTSSASPPLAGSPKNATLIQLLDHIADNIAELQECDEQTGETLYFGRNSLPALFQCLLSTTGGDRHQQLLPPGISIGSAFGLTNRTPLHPFGSLWAATARVTLGDILGSLPSTEKCMRYYRAYAQIVLPFVPYLLDSDEFERRLYNVMQLVRDRSDNPARSKAAAEMPYEDLAWYALLFAVLASGCQFADDVSSQRILTTRVFVACSFECLRLANFYVQPLLESIQTTLILEYVIANDSNPGVGWTFLANSARQAESRGLHMLIPRKGDDGASANVAHPLWRAVIHLDCMLAFAFDRRLLSFLPLEYDAAERMSASSRITFHDLSHAAHCLKLRWQTMRTSSSDAAVNAQQVRSYLARLEHIRSLAESDHSTLKEGSSMQSKLEQLVLSVHLKHFEAEIYRAGALSIDTADKQREQWFQAMEVNYIHVVETFISLKPLSPIAMSWGVLFCGVSAGLVLASLDFVQRSQEHRALLQSLFEILMPFSLPAAVESACNNTLTTCRTAMQVVEALLERSQIEAEERQER